LSSFSIYYSSSTTTPETRDLSVGHDLMEPTHHYENLLLQEEEEDGDDAAGF